METMGRSDEHTQSSVLSPQHSPRIGLLHTRLRIEEKRLGAALTARGATVMPLPEGEVAFDLHGRGYRGLDAVVERVEDYTLAQTALRMLEHLGVPTVNRAATVDLCGNKALMTKTLVRAGVPTPRAEVALGTAAALAAVERLGYPVVIKPLVGGQTRLLGLLEDREAAEAVIEHKEMLGADRQHVYYLQEYIPKRGRDIRVLIVGDEPVVAESRRSAEWIASRDLRNAEPCPLTPEIAELARAAARALGGGMLEVDLFERDHGLLVNEVGNLTHFRTFEKVGKVDVAGAIADYVLTIVNAEQRAVRA